MSTKNNLKDSLYHKSVLFDFYSAYISKTDPNFLIERVDGDDVDGVNFDFGISDDHRSHRGWAFNNNDRFGSDNGLFNNNDWFGLDGNFNGGRSNGGL